MCTKYTYWYTVLANTISKTPMSLLCIYYYQTHMLQLSSLYPTDSTLMGYSIHYTGAWPTYSVCQLLIDPNPSTKNRKNPKSISNFI